MVNYDFTRLNDKEFEGLSADIVENQEKYIVERFKQGKDLGIDGRFYISPDKKVIIQAKHYVKSGIAALLSNLEKEVIKVRKLDPSRYIIVTSVPLSPMDKNKILKIFSPYIKLTSDVYGHDDITAIISNNNRIEEKHYKLWFSSISSLQNVFFNAIKGRSKYLLDNYENDVKKFVLTENYNYAISTLEKKHSVIITGSPGIGKTTLANQLCLKYVKNGFDIYCIDTKLEEAEQIYQADKKQLFYFDDFLGRNYLELINENKDSKIINFIHRVSKDETKRFILTSRTNIINQARYGSELIRNSNIKENEFEIKIDSLTFFDKAKILYNHIYFSQLDNDHINIFYENCNYIKIIKHPNFNPRIISHITDFLKIKDIASIDYWDHIRNMFLNPHDVWDYFFKKQLNEQQKHLIYLVSIHGSRINDNILRKSFNCLIIKNYSDNAMNYIQNYDDDIKLICGSAINRYLDEKTKEVSYTLFNPSLGDYLLRNYTNNPELFSHYFTSLKTINVARKISDLYRNKMINEQFIDIITKYLFKKEFEIDYLPFYLRYCYFLIDTDQINGYEEYVINQFYKIRLFYEIDFDSYVGEIILLAIKLNKIGKNEILQYLDNILSNQENLEHEEFVYLSKIIFSFNEDILTEKLKECIIDYWEYGINSYLDGYDLDKIIAVSYACYEDEFDIIHETETLNNIINIVWGIIGEYSIDFDSIESIIDYVDINPLIEKYSDTYSSYHDERHTSIRNDDFDSDKINDLFYRS